MFLPPLPHRPLCAARPSTWSVLCGLICWLTVTPLGRAVAWAEEDEPAPAPAAAPVVVPLDFTSKFDRGRYGRKLAEMVWQKLERRGRFVIPESIGDVRTRYRQQSLDIGPDSSLDEVAAAVRGLAGQIGIWGTVERVAGSDRDQYDLTVRIADFGGAAPLLIYEDTQRTTAVSQIPQIVETALDRLDAHFGFSASARRSIAGDADRDLADVPSLLPGDFERGTRAPQGWEALREHVAWVDRTRADDDRGRFIRFTLPQAVAETSGVLYYSEPFPIEAHATYEFTCRWRSNGPAAKVFVKCYDQLPTRFAQRGEGTASSERREVYRSQQNLRGTTGEWNLHRQSFTPQHARYTPRWARVMLYAYLSPGTVDWDDVEVRLVHAASAPSSRF